MTTDKQEPVAVTEVHAFVDNFRGDNASLLRNTEALLALDAKGCLVPHGIGGHARRLLSTLAHRLASRSGGGVAELDSLEKFDGVGPHSETIETRARIGERYLEAYESALDDPLLKGYCPADCPSELLLDLLERLRALSTREPTRDEAREADIELLDARMILENGVTSANGCLEDPKYRPEREHLEGLRNRMERALEGINKARVSLTRPDPSPRDGMREALERALLICEAYADFIRSFVKADDLEMHPYLPDLDDDINDFRTALSAPARMERIP